jgi:hypothetical protein
MIPFIAVLSFWAGPILGPHAEAGVGFYRSNGGIYESSECFVRELCWEANLARNCNYVAYLEG